jgi:hypothetical protein
VFGDAQVYGNAWVYGNAQVYGNAWVFGNAHVYGNAHVFGNAHVYGNARVSGDAWAHTPLYIQGTRHAVTLTSHTQIAIGCHIYDIEYWQKHYRVIGRIESYTKEQIAEYRAYINLCAKTAKQLVVNK